MKNDLFANLSHQNLDAIWVTGPLQHNPDMVYFTGIHHVNDAELIIKANEQEVHTLNGLQDVLNRNRDGAVLLECHNGRIGYFRAE